MKNIPYNVKEQKFWWHNRLVLLTDWSHVHIENKSRHHHNGEERRSKDNQTFCEPAAWSNADWLLPTGPTHTWARVLELLACLCTYLLQSDISKDQFFRVNMQDMIVRTHTNMGGGVGHDEQGKEQKGVNTNKRGQRRTEKKKKERRKE